jgi:hypothetical protein
MQAQTDDLQSDQSKPTGVQAEQRHAAQGLSLAPRQKKSVANAHTVSFPAGLQAPRKRPVSGSTPATRRVFSHSTRGLGQREWPQSVRAMRSRSRPVRQQISKPGPARRPIPVQYLLSWWLLPPSPVAIRCQKTPVYAFRGKRATRPLETSADGTPPQPRAPATPPRPVPESTRSRTCDPGSYRHHRCGPGTSDPLCRSSEPRRSGTNGPC